MRGSSPEGRLRGIVLLFQLVSTQLISLVAATALWW
jgi:hypothetical protein